MIWDYCVSRALQADHVIAVYSLVGSEHFGFVTDAWLIICQDFEHLK